MDPVIWIVMLTVSGSVIGSAIGALKMPTVGYICNMLCFAAGVMLAISFLEFIGEGLIVACTRIAILGLTSGAFFMYLPDNVISHIHPRLCSFKFGCKTLISQHVKYWTPPNDSAFRTSFNRLR